MKRFKGLTLIELLAVVFIIGILTLLLVGPIQAARIRGRDSQRKADLNTIAQAIDLYYAQTHQLPNQTDCVNGLASTSQPTNQWISDLYANLSTYMPSAQGKGLPVDPVNDSAHHYTYSCNSVGTALYTLSVTLENSNDPGGVTYTITR